MKPFRTVAAAAASALLALSACGSSASLATDEQGMRSGSSGPAQVGSADDELTVDGDTGRPVESRLDEDSFLPTIANAQLAASTTRMDISMDLAGQSVTVTGQLLAADTVEASAMQLDMGVPGAGNLEMILVDGVLYLNAGAATEERFAELRLDDPAAEQYLGQLRGQLNPAEMAKGLEGALTGFEAAGTDPVDGRDASKYVLEVDTAKVHATGGVTEVPGLELPKTLIYTFWLDDEQRPVRITIDMGDLGAVEMSFSGWGEAVDIQAPPRSQLLRPNPFAPPRA